MATSLHLEAANLPEDAIEVARIADAWGIKGWIRVQPFSSDPRALFSSKRWFLKPGDGPGPKPGQPVEPALMAAVQLLECVAVAGDVRYFNSAPADRAGKQMFATLRLKAQGDVIFRNGFDGA